MRRPTAPSRTPPASCGAAGGPPDRGAALLALLNGHADQEGATLAELRVGVLPNDENPPDLEARAWEAFRVRLGRAEGEEDGQRLPEDPRVEG